VQFELLKKHERVLILGLTVVWNHFIWWGLPACFRRVDCYNLVVAPRRPIVSNGSNDNTVSKNPQGMHDLSAKLSAAERAGAVHDRVSINTLCFLGSSFRELAGYWHELGATRVSMVSNLLLQEGVSAAQAALASGDFRVETIAHPFVNAGHLQANKNWWVESRDQLLEVIDAARSINARSIYVSSGGHGTLTWEEAADVFCAAIGPCVAEAKAAGVALMIENGPQVYPDTTIVHSLRDAVTLAEKAGIGVCIDIFSCWVEAGLRDSIERAIPHCRIVQVSDYVYGDRSLPARAVPGDGAIPLRRILGWLLASGYDGAFDLELMGPRIDREGRLGATRRAAENLGALLRSLGA
jgi:sugar phosphate isomerase/epimerase